MSKASEKAAEAAEKAKGLFKGFTSKVKNLKGGKEEKDKHPSASPRENGASGATSPSSVASPGRSHVNPGGADLSKWEALQKSTPSSSADRGLPPASISTPEVAPKEPEHNVLEDLPTPDQKKSPKLDHANATRVGESAQARKPPTRKKREINGGAAASSDTTTTYTPAAAAPIKERPAPPPSSSKPGVTPVSSQTSLISSSPSSGSDITPVSTTSSPYTTAPVSQTGQTEFIRVFLEDDSMKAINITVPCSVADLTDALRKKMYMVDTTGYQIFEYRGSKQLRVLTASDDVRAVMSSWAGDPLCKFVFKPGDAADVSDEPTADPFPVHHLMNNNHRPQVRVTPVKQPEPEELPEPEDPPLEQPPPLPLDEPPSELPPAIPAFTLPPEPEPTVFEQPTDLSQGGSALGALLAARKPAGAKTSAMSRPGPASAQKSNPTPVITTTPPPANVTAAPAAVPKATVKPVPATASLVTTATPSMPTTTSVRVIAKPVAAKPGSKVAAITTKTDLSKKPPRTWTTEEVVEWMNGASLSHSWVFFENRLTGQQLMDANLASLQELGVDEAAATAIVKAVEKLKEERLNMLKNIRANAAGSTNASAAAATATAAAAATTTTATTTTPAAATPKAGAALKPASVPKPAAVKAEAAPVASPKLEAKPAALKPAMKPTAQAKPAAAGGGAAAAAAAAAPAGGAAAKAKGKEMIGLTLDATGEGTVRVYIGESWRAFYLTGSTTADDLCNTIQLRCSSLLASCGLDTGSCGLYEVKNMTQETLIEGTAIPLTLCRAWVGNSTRFVYRDKNSVGAKATKEVMKVFNADGSGKALVVASSVTVAEFLPVLADNMKVENPGSYKLWELDDLTGESHELGPDDNVWMTKAKWLGSDEFRFVYSPTKPTASPSDVKETMSLVQKKQVTKTKSTLEQIKAFLGWANVVLAKKSMSIDSLDAFRDGVKLHTITEIISGKPLGKLSANPITIRQRVENVTAVQSYWASKGWTFSGFFPEDVVDANPSAIAAYLWPMVCNSFQPNFKFATESESRAEMLQWARMKAAPTKIENFDASWKDGLGFCTILAKLRPASISIADAQANKERAVQMAMAAAESAGVPKGMLWIEAFTQPDWQPDERSVFTYLAVYYRLFAAG